MEWKADEILMFEKAMKIINWQELPMLGLQSGVGFANPGLGVWIFSLMAIIAKTPPQMVRIIQLMNILSILFFYLFIISHIKKERQAPWLWGLGLFCISPLAILFSRKIWAQDILPFFSFFVFFSHWYRRKALGAFSWGLLGALIGQIHMSGFLYAFALVSYSIIIDLKNKHFDLKLWSVWFLGSIIGLIPLIPWLIHIATHTVSSNYSPINILGLNFFMHWFSTACGINLEYSLGHAFWHFITWPILFGKQTYLMALSHLFLLGCGLYAIFEWIWQKFSPSKKSVTQDISSSKKYPKLYEYLFSLGIVGGIIFTLSGFHIPTHYLIILFPFPFIWLCLLFIQRKKMLFLIIICQLAISISFLNFIHTNGGAILGDYGTVYRLQNYQLKLKQE